MKKSLSIILAVVCVLSLAGCGSSSGAAKNSVETVNGDHELTIWIFGDYDIADLTKKQIETFNVANPDRTVQADIRTFSSWESISALMTNSEDIADLFLFPQDQLNYLISAGILMKLNDEDTAAITAQNDAVSVASCTFDNKLYAYPMTNDNGYFMYYDKSIIGEDQIDDLETLLDVCNENDMSFCMDYMDSAWYSASFFLGTGCISEWVVGEDGNFVSYNDTYNSEEGLIAMKGLELLAKSPITYSSSITHNFSKDAAVVITGAWAYDYVKELWGDNVGVTDLPSFTVDGESYHMGSFAGTKLLGVKHQEDEEKAAVCRALALYLTGESCQMERYTELGWGPTNLNAQQSEAVKSDTALAALSEQSAYAVPQGQYPNEWWSIALSLGDAARHAESDEDLKAALAAYEESISALCP